MTEPTTERYPEDENTRTDPFQPPGDPGGIAYWQCDVPGCTQSPVRGTEYRPYGRGTCLDHPRNALRPVTGG